MEETLSTSAPAPGTWLYRDSAPPYLLGIYLEPGPKAQNPSLLPSPWLKAASLEASMNRFASKGHSPFHPWCPPVEWPTEKILQIRRSFRQALGDPRPQTLKDISHETLGFENGIGANVVKT